MKAKVNRRQFVAGTTAALSAGLAVPRVARCEADKWGDLIGRFVYDGPAPERKKLKVDKDIECCGKFDIRDEGLMVGDDGGLGNVFVYVRSQRVDICPDLKTEIEEKVVLDNRDCIFKPHCMALWVDEQALEIVNSDPVAQNVAFTPLLDRPANIILPAPPAEGSKATWQFRRDQRIPVPIKCNYHPWESAHLLPKSHPYVAISDMNGVFQIPKLPLGELEFQVWHERIGYLDTTQWPKGRFKIDIQPGANDLGTIKLPPAKFQK
jgi:hypothetical protein